MVKYRILELSDHVEVTNRFQIQYSLFTLFGKTLWVSFGHPFPTLESAKKYITKLQTPYVEKVVWESD
jgi:hypothetical protein